MRIRPSAIWLARICPPSRHAPDIYIDPVNGAINAGNQIHKIIADFIDHKPPIISEISDDLVRKAYFSFLNYWNEGIFDDEGNTICPPLSQLFINPETEVAVGGGTADLISVNGETAYLADWKLGIIERDASDQLHAYAKGILDLDKNITKVFAIQLNLFSKSAQILQITYLDLILWELELDSIFKHDNYHPGDHCRFCQRRYECEALNTMTSNALQVITGGGELDIVRDGIYLYQACNEIRRKIDELQDRIKLEVKSGVKITDGEYELLQGSPVEKIDWAAAKLIVINKFGILEIIDNANLSKTQICDMARARARSLKASGEKITAKALIDEILEDLKNADAFRLTDGSIRLKKITTTGGNSDE